MGFKGETNGEHIRGARECRRRVPSFFLLSAPALIFYFNFPPPFLIKTPYTRIGFETLCDSFACLPRAPVKKEVGDLQNKLVDSDY